MSRNKQLILKYTAGLIIAILLQMWLQSRGLDIWHWFK